MQITLSELGLSLVGGDGRIRLGAAPPAATLLVGGRRQDWDAATLSLDADRGVLVAAGGPGGTTIEVQARHMESAPGGLADEVSGAPVEVTVRLRNDGPQSVGVDRIVLLRAKELVVGEDPGRWRAYRNGYQSWSGTRSIGTSERDADVPTRLIRLSTTDGKHPSPSRRGHVRSDSLSVVCEPVSGDALGVAFTDLASSFGFVELLPPGRGAARLEVWSDHDGVPLEPGDSVSATVVIAATSGISAGWDALGIVASAAGAAMTARGAEQHHPAGWCSWYYYFAKVTEADVVENLEVLAADGRDGPDFGCEYVMVDDGHQSSIGDWLRTDTDRFPSGMAPLASRIRAEGFEAGIWWAPFLVHPDSRTATDHPDWLVRNGRGRPIVGILNPVWSSTTPMRVLDTTNPEVLAHLRSVAATIGSDWGYSIQKLDFLYAAALPGVRADRSATRAQSLRRGLEAIREGAGDESFLLGCGCPLGPAVGVVDAMRIGADVTPYWSNAIDRFGGRGRHGLATRNAVVNILTRAVLDRRWWLNDPDCLMVRDTDTRLDEEEVRLLATVIGITDGMVVISDRLSRLGEARRAVIRSARELAGGRVEVADLFERGVPGVVLSHHENRVDVAVLSMEDRPTRVNVDLRRRGLLCPDGPVREFWTGRTVQVSGGLADLGVLPPHSARVLRIPVPG
jgi:alpha-galactosidase